MANENDKFVAVIGSISDGKLFISPENNGAPVKAALTLTSIRRRFPDDGFFNLLAQNGDTIITQRGHHLVTQDEINAPDVVEATNPTDAEWRRNYQPGW